MEKRSVAKKIPINELIKGTFIKRPGWEPSGVLTKYGEISRVCIIGLVVSLSQTDNSGSFLVDDGTGSITIRYFESKPEYEQLKLGELVKIIGRVRENQNSIYLVPEILRSTNENWHKVHGLELALQKKAAIKLPVESDQEEIVAGPYQQILNVIAMLDKGSGVDIENIISAAKIDDCDKIISSLIAEGEIFEISPGKVKLLE